MGPRDAELTSLLGNSHVGLRTTVPIELKEIAPPGGHMTTATRSSCIYPSSPERGREAGFASPTALSVQRDYCTQLQRLQIDLTIKDGASLKMGEYGCIKR